MKTGKIIVEFKNVTKEYPLNLSKRTLLGNLAGFLKKKKERILVKAAERVDFSLKEGEVLGIIGENASGKTTILRIINGIITPTNGEVKVKGKVVGLLDLGAGFYPELTGRENMVLNCVLLGMKKHDSRQTFEKIIEFSGIADFIDAQVKTYSQGMLVRLGFAIAIHAEFDIFLIDDTLAVGDEEFQRKCLNKVMELKELGKTIVIVSHDLNAISQICTRAILLKNGSVVMDGCVNSVVRRYAEAVGDRKSVACIDKDNLSLIFNSGKVILLWKGAPVTKNFGGYISFLAFEKWIMSWDARWKVTSRSNDVIEAEGEWPKYEVKIKTKIKVENERLLRWHFTLEIPLSIEAKKAAVGLMANDLYDHYLNDDRIEEITLQPAIAGQWQDLYRTDEDNAPLVILSEKGLPALTVRFDGSFQRVFQLIQLTGADLQARVLQRQLILGKNEKGNFDGKYLVSSNADIELSEPEQAYKLADEIASQKSISSPDARISLKRNKLAIFYANNELTVDKGLNFGFFRQGNFFDLFDGQWRMQKTASDSMIISSKFKNLMLELRLRLELKNNSINWAMKINSAEKQGPESLFARLFLSRKYEKYFDIVGENNFLSACEHDEQVQLLHPECGFVGLIAGEERFPAIIFQNGHNGVLELQNAGVIVDGRILADKRVDTNAAEGTILLFGTLREKEKYVACRQEESGSNKIQLNSDFSIGFGRDKIGIYYRGKEITADEGFSSGIYYNGRWHESKNLFKEFKRQGKSLKVCLKRQIPEVEEVWNISYEGAQINWEVELLKAPKISSELNCKAGIVLKPDFVQWAHSFNTGSFCDGAMEKGMLDLDDANNSLLAVKAADTSLPPLYFEKKSALNPSGVIIQDDAVRRSLHFKFKGGRKTGDENSQKIFSGSIIMNNRENWDDEIIRHRLQNFSLLAENGLQLFLASNKASLIFEGRQLTEKDGLRVSLVSDERDFDTYYASWILKKAGREKISVQLKWGDFPLEQKWFFELKNGMIEWTVVFTVKGRFLLKKLSINLFFGTLFNKWAAGSQKGKIDFQESENDSITVFDNRSGFIGLYRDKPAPANPMLVLNPMVDMNEWFLHIHKYYAEKAAVCGVNCIIDGGGKYLAAGQHQLFKGRVFLSETGIEFSDKIIDAGMPENHSKMSCGKLSLAIDKAKVRLFWQGRELTKTLGLFSAFFYKGNWINSTLAKWQTEIYSDNAAVSLSWSTLSILQKWQLRIVNEKEIFWQLDTYAQETRINSLEAALMLNENYDCYQIDKQAPGRFPRRFEDDRWVQAGIAGEFIKVFSQDGKSPKMVFKGNVSDYPYYILAENSDALHSARVLKCESKATPENNNVQGQVSLRVTIIIDD